MMLILLALVAAVPPNAPEPVSLWPDGEVPGAVGQEDQDRPHVYVYSPTPEDNTGCAIVVTPGGGYGALAMDHEGHQIGLWAKGLGITAVVVRYRLGPRYQHPAPLQDVSRAIRYARANAEDLGVDKKRVGVFGFSAGGHLASTLSTHYDAGDAASEDPIERQPSRPDFAILAYPVISMDSGFTHGGSRRNLLGKEPDPKAVADLSNETQVTEDTPPTFLFHTADDAGVPVRNSLVYYDALNKHGVDAELHVFRHGRHGVGFATGHPTLGVWPDLLHNWLRDGGWLTADRRIGIQGTLTGTESYRIVTMTWTPPNDHLPRVTHGVRDGKFSVPSEFGPVPVLGQPYTVLVDAHAKGPSNGVPSMPKNKRLGTLLMSVTPGGDSHYKLDMASSIEALKARP